MGGRPGGGPGRQLVHGWNGGIRFFRQWIGGFSRGAGGDPPLVEAEGAGVPGEKPVGVVLQRLASSEFDRRIVH